MPILATGLFETVAYKVEAAFGTIPAATGPNGQLLRRVTSSLDLTKDVYQSNEIRPDMQIADLRHGMRHVKGTLAGELSPKTYADFFSAACKRPYAAGASLVAASITVAGTGPSYTLTRAAGSYLTDGVKVGDILRLSVGAFNPANINKNVMVVSLVAAVATVVVLNASALVAEGPISGATVSVQGKKTFVAATAQTDLSFSIEHWYGDVVQSEVFSGCKVSKIALNLPTSGMATCGIDFMGQNVTTAQAQYFTSPLSTSALGTLAAVNGVLRVNGAVIAIVTGLSTNLTAAFTEGPVIGANQIAALFAGTVKVDGQFTAYFLDNALRDTFYNETEIDLYAAFTTDNTATADFIAIGMPRIKVTTATKNDGPGGKVQTFAFTALLNKNGGAGIATEYTTFQCQDSAA